MSLAKSQLDWFAARLSIALYDTNQELRMGRASELKAALHFLPGIETLAFRYGSGGQYITVAGKTVFTPVAATNEQIVAAFNKLKINTITETKPMATTTGASYLANLIRTRQAKVKTQLAEAGNEMNAVMDEMESTANDATKQVADAKAELADLKAALGLNSNGAPAE